MYRYVLVLIILIASATVSHAQKYTVEKSTVIFFSDAAIEDITAKNNETSGLLNVSSGEFAFLIPIKKFRFDKSLMEEHFNEKYLESEKFPNSIFKGTLEGLQFDKAYQELNAVGILTIHGVSRDVRIPARIERSGNKLIARSKFVIKLEEYKIKIPQLMWQNIAEEIEVTVEFIYKPI
jgi:polyisoprenoid-binding protein YceI